MENNIKNPEIPIQMQLDCQELSRAMKRLINSFYRDCGDLKEEFMNKKLILDLENTNIQFGISVQKEDLKS